MNESLSTKIKYVGEVSRLNYIRLHCSVIKRTCSNWPSNVAVCMLEYTVTDHESILAVNEFDACTNLVKFIFKSFVSCNL